MGASVKIWSYTFGCKVNQYETEALRQRLSGRPDHIVDKPEDADLCLINSCSVTSFADKECRNIVRRVLKANSHARVVVTGCYATRAPGDIRKISPRVEVYSNQEKESLPSCLGFEVAQEPLGIRQFTDRTRAFLKIQDGCTAPCRYCIIPAVRPGLWSKPAAHVLSEFQGLVENGYQEIVLTGIRLGLYGDGKGRARKDLLSLLKELLRLPGRFRIRLSSLEVTEVTEPLVKLVAESSQICRHFHVPLQSGDDTVLKAMGRWYDTALFRKKADLIRKYLPDAGLTTDVMVGYPVEGDAEFLNCVKFIEDVEFSGLHVFRFSQREGTAAARLKPLDPRVLSRRGHLLGQLDQRLRRSFYRRFRGTRREILPEPSGDGWTDNYIRVTVPKAVWKWGLHTGPVNSPVLEAGELSTISHQ